MKVKIINPNSEDYQKELKLRRMNYDQVVVNYPDSKGIRVFNKDSVEFITETEIDEFLVKYNDFLKIKLNRGISVALYKAILDTIENEYNIEFKSLNLLKDKYAINKRGVWEKEILCVINEIIPIKINASGQNFKKSGFNININEYDSDRHHNHNEYGIHSHHHNDQIQLFFLYLYRLDLFLTQIHLLSFHHLIFL